MSLDRYSTEMSSLFSEEYKYKTWAEVEIALLKAYVRLGIFKEDDVDFQELEKAKEELDPARVKEIEKEINHDLMAVVKALNEKAPKSGKYLHVGATSYDIEDTATALIFKKAFELILKELDNTLSLLKEKAKKFENVICIGRTHGQHAIPTTYGMKFALYYQDFMRCKQRIIHAKERILVGKMSGAVGTMAGFFGKGIEIEQEVMKELGLNYAKISTQVVQRDVHAEAVFLLTLISCNAEKFAKEIRNLQRTEIGEVLEMFEEKQVGSSTMPHKRNPHKAERICSLAKLIRANMSIALENIALEHERDLTNSANERFLFAQQFILTHYVLKEVNKILKNMKIYEQKGLENLWLTKGLIFAERVMLELTKRGMNRQEAHEVVRKIAQNCYESKAEFKKLLSENAIVSKYLNNKDLEQIFDAYNYLGNHKEIIKRALED
ncbi:MAG: adenylosuccinate lyase [Candidatus Micrarchaeota archaeon]|nr:adenylosuccinate lyase [Candidatus Micrarchaeota archaeon]